MIGMAEIAWLIIRQGIMIKVDGWSKEATSRAARRQDGLAMVLRRKE